MARSARSIPSSLHCVFVCVCVCESADRSMAGHQGAGRRLLRGLPVTSPSAAAQVCSYPSRPLSPPAVPKVTACQQGKGRAGGHQEPDASPTLMGLSILLRSTRGAGSRVMHTHTHTYMGVGGPRVQHRSSPKTRPGGKLLGFSLMLLKLRQEQEVKSSHASSANMLIKFYVRHMVPC